MCARPAEKEPMEEPKIDIYEAAALEIIPPVESPWSVEELTALLRRNFPPKPVKDCHKEAAVHLHDYHWAKECKAPEQREEWIAKVAYILADRFPPKGTCGGCGWWLGGKYNQKAESRGCGLPEHQACGGCVTYTFANFSCPHYKPRESRAKVTLGHCSACRWWQIVCEDSLSHLCAETHVWTTADCACCKFEPRESKAERVAAKVLKYLQFGVECAPESLKGVAEILESEGINDK